MYVRPALKKHFMGEDRKFTNSPGYKPKLWASELGGCLRKAMMRIAGYAETIPFGESAKEAMNNGVVYEGDTLTALEKYYGKENVTTQLVLKNDLWSCKADFVLFHGTDHPIIIEHKAVGEKWWNYKDSLPHLNHVMQVWLYGYLYKSLFNVEPKIILYYRSWGNYAEMNVFSDEKGVYVNGEMNGIPYQKDLGGLFPDDFRKEAEAIYLSGIMPEKLEGALRDGNCLFNNKPSCPFYYHCWSK